MKKLIYLLALTLISSAAYSQKADFTGKWKLNKEKSELSEQFSMAPQKVEIEMEKNSLVETRHSSFQGESFTSTDTYTLDGKECENVGWMDSVKKSTASWSDDKTVLKITTEIPMQDGGSMTINTAYSLKGSSLVIKTSASSSFGEMAETFIFDKE